jgi:O-acetyl-ADP-ribose deacetylase (regulator of RNase III)
MSSITICIGNPDDTCELQLSTMRSLSDLSDNLTATMEACKPSEIIQLSLCPPVPKGLSVRSAFKMIADTWTAFDPTLRPSVNCVVASEMVSDVLYSLMPGRSEAAETKFKIGLMTLTVAAGDITAFGADAVVNASNTSLRLGGGVSAAIRQACGPGLPAEMAGIARRRSLADGDAVVTGSHGLKTARYIIHAATAAGDADTISRSIRNVLRLSVEQQFGNLAMPALGTGTGGMPIERFAEVLASEVQRHAESGASLPRLLRLVLYRRSDYTAVTNVLRPLFPPV